MPETQDYDQQQSIPAMLFVSYYSEKCLTLLQEIHKAFFCPPQSVMLVARSYLKNVPLIALLDSASKRNEMQANFMSIPESFSINSVTVFTG